MRERFSALTEDWTDPFLSSSSSEEEDEYQRDVQLRQDIHQLERTLNNYDTQFDRRDREHRELAKQKLLKLKVRGKFCNFLIVDPPLSGPGEHLSPPGSVRSLRWTGRGRSGEGGGECRYERRG